MAAKVIRLSGVVVSGHEREGPYRVERAGIREASSVVRLLSGCSLVVGGWVPGSGRLERAPENLGSSHLP